jgi:hypothetical protein
MTKPETDTCVSGTYRCRNCGADLTDPKNAGFPFDGDWFCGGFCAEVCAGFWTRGNSVSDFNSQLSDGNDRCIPTETEPEGSA